MIQNKITIPRIKEAKKLNEKLTMLTAYDFQIASILDESLIDMILVGDSLGNVIYGEKNTLKVSVNDIIRHTKGVVKGVKRSLVISDLPFMSYQASVRDAIYSSGKILKHSGSMAVKLEGGH